MTTLEKKRLTEIANEQMDIVTDFISSKYKRIEKLAGLLDILNEEERSSFKQLVQINYIHKNPKGCLITDNDLSIISFSEYLIEKYNLEI